MGEVGRSVRTTITSFCPALSHLNSAATALLFNSPFLSMYLNDSHLTLKTSLACTSQGESQNIRDLLTEVSLEVFLILMRKLIIREGSDMSKVTQLVTSRDEALTLAWVNGQGAGFCVMSPSFLL